MDNVISILSGTESIPGAVYRVDMNVTTVDGKRLQLSFSPQSENKFVSGRGLRPEVAGEMLNRSYRIPDDKLLVVSATRKGSGPRTSRKIVVRVDHRAPYNRLSVPCSGHDKAVAGSMYIEGHFWILDPASGVEAAKFSPIHQPFFHNPFDVFDSIQELHPGAAQPKVEQKTVTIDGEQKKVTISRPKRALRL